MLTIALPTVFGSMAIGAALPAADGAAAATLQRVQEIRRVELVEADDGFMMFDNPGLVLTFGIELPGDRKLLELEGPDTVTAADSEGTDLGAIEPGFRGEPEYVEIVQSFDEPATQFKFVLAVSSRAATTFDLQASLIAVTYTGTRDIEMTIGGDWVDLEDPAFGEGARARLHKANGTPQLTITPTSARAAIETIRLTSGDVEIEDSGAMWTDESITYMFGGQYSDSLVTHFTVRTGVERQPLEINLAEQPLP